MRTRHNSPASFGKKKAEDARDEKPDSLGQSIPSSVADSETEQAGVIGETTDHTDEHQRSGERFVRSLSTPPGEPYNDPLLRRKV